MKSENSFFEENNISDMIETLMKERDILSKSLKLIRESPFIFPEYNIAHLEKKNRYLKQQIMILNDIVGKLGSTGFCYDDECSINSVDF